MKLTRQAGVVAVLLAASGLMFWPSANGQQPKGAPQGPPPSPVAVAPVTESQVAASHVFTGTVMPMRTSSVGSAVDGRVTEYPVNEGDFVQQGQPIAQLLTGLIEIEKAAAEAQHKLAAAKLEQLRKTQQDQIAQAEARARNAKAQSEYAGARFRRVEKLGQQGTVTLDELQEAQAAADQAAAAYREAYLAWEVAKNAADPLMRQAEAEAATAAEEVNRIQDQINKHTIRMPFNGYVVEEHSEVGQWVARAGLLAKVVELAHVDVEVPVPESYVSGVVLGTKARVEIPSATQQELEGQVVAIVPEADARARTFRVKVRVPNRVIGGPFDGQLVPEIQDQLKEAHRLMLNAGMFARVVLPVGQTQTAVLIPKDALVLGGPSPVVYVFDGTAGAKQGTVRPEPVELGAAHGNLVEVKGALKPGQQVVVRGNERLRPGANVLLVEAAQMQNTVK